MNNETIALAAHKAGPSMAAELHGDWLKSFADNISELSNKQLQDRIQALEERLAFVTEQLEYFAGCAK